MESEIRVQRQFLIVMGGGLAIFLAMLFIFGQSGVAQGPTGNGGTAVIPSGNGEVQEVYVKALSTGVYDKQQITVKKGIPVRFHFSAEQGAGCGKVLVIRKFNVQLLSRNGEESFAEFTPTETGSFEYSCSMRMFRGTLNVVA